MSKYLYFQNIIQEVNKRYGAQENISFDASVGQNIENLRASIAGLPKEQRSVIFYKYGENMTDEEISNEIGVALETVCQIEQEAICNIYECMKQNLNTPEHILIQRTTELLLAPFQKNNSK